VRAEVSPSNRLDCRIPVFFRPDLASTRASSVARDSQHADDRAKQIVPDEQLPSAGDTGPDPDGRYADRPGASVRRQLSRDRSPGAAVDSVACRSPIANLCDLGHHGERDLLRCTPTQVQTNGHANGLDALRRYAFAPQHVRDQGLLATAAEQSNVGSGPPLSPQEREAASPGSAVLPGRPRDWRTEQHGSPIEPVWHRFHRHERPCPGVPGPPLTTVSLRESGRRPAWQTCCVAAL
jgi:hypothetical protein